MGPQDTSPHSTHGSPQSQAMKATVAVLSFSLQCGQAQRDGESLSSELQQLGLPQRYGDEGRQEW